MVRFKFDKNNNDARELLKDSEIYKIENMDEDFKKELREAQRIYRENHPDCIYCMFMQERYDFDYDKYPHCLVTDMKCKEVCEVYKPKVEI